MGNERRKGKKSNSEKPKQPQRGLGVAQLEKMIRLHGHTAYSSMASPSSSSSSSSFSSTSSASYGVHTSMMMGLGEYDKRQNIRYGDSQPCTTASWNPDNGMLDGTQHFVQPNQTRQLVNLHYVEDSSPKKEQETTEQLNMGSGSRNSESSDAQELDLELRLSL